jgi:hypothetical protein
MHGRKQKSETDSASRLFLNAGGNHKIEFVDTGKRGFGFLLGDCERIFDIDPLKCGVMRVDCAADITGIGIPWFQQRARVKWKQFANEIGELCMEPPEASASIPYSLMGKREIQTLYFGKRPNCYRIYDKIAEWRAEYRRFKAPSREAIAKRMINAGASPEDIEWRFRTEHFNPDADDCAQSFQEVYGVPESGYALTRCERQIGGGRVPTIPVTGKPAKEWERLETVSVLKKRLSEYDPFRDLEIIDGGQAEPARENYSLVIYMAGMYLRSRIERDGIQQTRAWLNSHQRAGAKAPSRNAKKLLETTFADFVSQSEHSISARDLFEQYRGSLLKQLAA